MHNCYPIPLVMISTGLHCIKRLWIFTQDIYCDYFRLPDRIKHNSTRESETFLSLSASPVALGQLLQEVPTLQHPLQNRVGKACFSAKANPAFHLKNAFLFSWRISAECENLRKAPRCSSSQCFKGMFYWMSNVVRSWFSLGVPVQEIPDNQIYFSKSTLKMYPRFLLHFEV